MLYVICGEDQAESRKKLLEFLEQDAQILRIDGKVNSGLDILNLLEQNPLFLKRKIVIIENISKVANFQDIASRLLKFEKDKDVDVVVWEGIDLSKTLISKFGEAKVFSYSLPKYFFKFLDNLLPKSKKESHELLFQVLASYEAEQIFYAIIKRVRLLMMIKTGDIESFSDLNKMAPWQLKNLQNQAGFWSEEQLRRLYLELSGIEEEMKTSSLSIDLARRLDILLFCELN